jgi:ABC-2 type transport system ATP-binding protein
VGVIATDGLAKSFGGVRALDGLDLDVSAGEIHGFLGPNGAGKTTTIRILLGMVRADGGSARVFEEDPWEGALDLHRRMAFVPGEVDLWGQLTGEETLDFLGRLRGGVDTENQRGLVARFELDLSRRVSTYSKGNRQKVALVAALASGAELFLFDEPTDGLDPLMVEVFREEVRRLRASGRTVLLSSHVLSEVEEVCDRVTIIREGRTVESGTLDALRHLARIEVRARTVRSVDGVTDLMGVFEVKQEGTNLTCEVDPDALDELLGHLHAAGIAALECHPPSLESIFLSHYAAGGPASP